MYTISEHLFRYKDRLPGINPSYPRLETLPRYGLMLPGDGY